MRHFSAALFLAALSSVALQGEIEERRGSAAPITIYTQFEQPCPDSAVAAMARELAEIMEPAGLDVEWRPVDSPRSLEPVFTLVVAGFKGSCDIEDLSGGRTGTGALGWTHTTDGDVLPFTAMDCDRIRGFIGPLVARAEQKDRETLMGRAMARVLAHELYHVLARTMDHAKVGVGKSRYTPRDLLSPQFRFEDRQCRALRTAMLPRLGRTLPHEEQPETGGF
ncbi:MAG TPA: hypothetical protein VN442_15595 [Bryobacteraceae bacterium]|nr:hypothetical protein [Bryobacteraceae bacterium]